MTRSFKHLAAVLAVFLAAALPARAAIVNGGFEAGLSGWTVADQVGSDGSFLVQSGSFSPINGIPVPVPPGGSNAAMTDAQGPGSHVLYQDFVQAAPVASAILHFDLFIGNQAGAFHVPGTLDFATTQLNQQARVDLLVAGADPFTLAGADLLLNLFATAPADPAISGYTHVAVDITSLLNANLGTSLRLRFAEVDNVNIFNFGVDNVMLDIDRTTPVPEPGSWWLVLAGLAVAALFARRPG